MKINSMLSNKELKYRCALNKSNTSESEVYIYIERELQGL